MERSTATDAEHLKSGETWRKVAKIHRADVEKARERNRLARLKWVLVFGLFLLAYLVKRAIENNPVGFGMPTFGPDFMLYMLPIAIVLMVGVAICAPLMMNRSPHVRFSPEEIPINFSDVRGVDTVLEEVTRSLQIFLTYKSFREELGGNPRRGILFEGPPGTGKTHIAKAMAAEAGVPFFFVSSPALTSMWQAGSSLKIRSFFKAVRKAARKEGGAIGFIEEIDAIGAARARTQFRNSVPRRTLEFVAHDGKWRQGLGGQRDADPASELRHPSVRPANAKSIHRCRQQVPAEPPQAEEAAG